MSAQPLEPLYVFAVWMLGERQAAFEAVCNVLEQTLEPAQQLPALVAMLTENRRTSSVARFAELDSILRRDTTVPVDLNHPLVRGDPQRLAVLLSELERTCLMSTVQGLPPLRRAVFVMLYVMDLSIESCAEICRSNESAVRVLETRARQTIEGYLTTRCEHMDRGNPCHCIARLGGALDRNFISWPDHDEHRNVSLAPVAPHRQVKSLYANQPRVRLTVL